MTSACDRAARANDSPNGPPPLGTTTAILRADEHAARKHPPGGTRAHHVGHVVALERERSIVSAACEHERAGLEDLGALLARDEEIAAVNSARGGARSEADRSRCDAGVERGADRRKRARVFVRERGHAAARRELIVEHLDGAARPSEPGGHGHSRRPGAHDDDVTRATRSLARRCRLERELAEPGDATREALHDRLDAGHAGEELVVIHPIREEPVRHPQEIGVARTKAVLRDDGHPVLRRHETRHDVRRLVHTREAAVARAAQARRSAGPMELRAPRDRRLPGRDERSRERLAALGNDLLAVEREGDGILDRSSAGGGHGERRRSGRAALYFDFDPGGTNGRNG